jgi:acyl dehydratase
VITAGDQIPALVVDEVRIEDIMTVMDVMGDVNPVHVDEDLVRRLGLRGPVNQGPANAAYVLNMVMAWLGDPTCVREFSFRFESISVPGDRLIAHGRVDAVEDRIATCSVWLDCDGGDRVMSGQMKVAVPQ